jgi:thiamine biosynthesis lipoprotein
MRTNRQNEVRRCRPLLGTFVEIQASGINAARLDHAIEAAFLAIARVHRLMSFHDPESELSRINREALCEWVRVHPWTWRVLKCAQEFSRRSNGIFDITMARQLVEWNYLPRHDASIGSGSWRDIVLEDNCQVRFRKPVVVDLGGIAKGFAVDRAVKALEHNGVRAAIVNAGGDLRAFGRASRLVHLRRPAAPTRAGGAVKLCNRAMATSGIYFACKKKRCRRVSPLVAGDTGRAVRELISVTVGAADCMTADALTKIVFVLRERAAPLLARYSADALVLEQDGALSWMVNPPCDTSRQS